MSKVTNAEHRGTAGIYRIINLVNNKQYIGSAVDLYNRKHTHLSLLMDDKHHSIHLQRSYNKHGLDAFSFEVLITCAQSMLIWYEQQFLDQIQPEYNILLNARSPVGHKHTDEYKEACRQRMMGQQRNLGNKHTEETKRKISDARRGQDNGWTGRKHTAETKKKMSESQRKRYGTI